MTTQQHRATRRVLRIVLVGVLLIVGLWALTWWGLGGPTSTRDHCAAASAGQGIPFP